MFALCVLGQGAPTARGGDENDPTTQRFFFLDNAGRSSEAEQVARQALADAMAQGRTNGIGNWANRLGNSLRNQGRYAEAISYLEQALANRERYLGPSHNLTADTMNNLAVAYCDLGQYARAIALHQRALAILRQVLGEGHVDVARSYNNLANVYLDQGRYADAESFYKQALAICERALGAGDPVVADYLNNLANVSEKQGRYNQAEAIHRRALAIREKALGRDHPDVAQSLNNLANVYYEQGRYTEAETLYRRTLAIREKVLGAEHPDLADSLNNLANVYAEQGRHAEAEPLYKRTQAIVEKGLGAEHPRLALAMTNVATVYVEQGRFAEAEPLLKTALSILQKALGAEHPDVARSHGHLANLYSQQGRFAEAEPLAKSAASIREKAFGAEHPDVASSLDTLADIYSQQKRYAEAEPLFKRARSIRQKALGAEHPNVASSLDGLASVYREQGRYADAEALYNHARAIREKAFGPDHPSVAYSLEGLTELKLKQGNKDDAERLLDRALNIRERAAVSPGTRFWGYDLRARLAWERGERDDALNDLRHALDLAEQQRGQASGAEHERAQAYAQFAHAFERMVDWQTTLGNASEVFLAIERAHARSLLDEIAMTGADLQVGRPAAEREALRQREGELKSRVAQLEKQMGLPGADNARLESGLAAARAALYDHYRDQRSSSPVYRNLLASGGGPPRLSQVRRRLPEATRLLLYFIGEEASYLLAVENSATRLFRLSVAEPEAKLLAIDAGPLTSARLQRVLGGNEGVVAGLSHPETASEQNPKLAALWRVLVPESEQPALCDGTIRHLCIVPDASLALLPFEALVIDAGESPRYLLDAGPPIDYAPSAAVLDNLSQQTASKPEAGREPVLALGDPAYPAAPTAATDSGTLLTSRSRYGSSGGKLARLPYSGWEAQWVARGYNDRGIRAGVLSGPTATEAGLRYWAPGRKVLHLACHGLADQNHGNFFGALALTPGPKGSADPADDGFLTLPEIYALNLKGCELTILSACQTNYGPQQKGEGTWALSRGFLVAGSRRVVASNWLVDDEAAASLVSIYCAALAQAEKEGKPIDHAAALQTAKKWVRQQEKWKNPYYWASMVLVGPS